MTKGTASVVANGFVSYSLLRDAVECVEIPSFGGGSGFKSWHGNLRSSIVLLSLFKHMSRRFPQSDHYY
jgi:hypothetical protein